jgi:ParB-like chromosome segregation protein Spo0J
MTCAGRKVQYEIDAFPSQRRLPATIKRFGFTKPILVDTSSGILAGHARLLAAPAPGLELVPVIVLDHPTVFASGGVK